MRKIKNQIQSRIGIVLLAALSMFLIQCSSSKENQTTSNTTNPSGVLEVHFIDVGQGDAILVEDEDADMLIDAGNNDQAKVVTDYLKSEKIKDLDYVIGTHPHSDHIGGMDTVLNTIPAEQVILPAVNYNTKTFDDVLDAIGSHKIKVDMADAGDKYHLGDAIFTIMAPNSAVYDDLNNYSVCIKLTYGKISFLLTGDAEDLSEREMIKSGMDLSADVLKLGHHGSAYSTSEAFLKAVHPSCGVVSAGKDNDYGHPNIKVMRSMLNHHISVFRTDKQGTIIFKTDGKSLLVDKEIYQITNHDIGG